MILEIIGPSEPSKTWLVKPRHDIMEMHGKIERPLYYFGRIEWMEIPKCDVEPLVVDRFRIGEIIETNCKSSQMRVTGFEYLANRIICVSCKASSERPNDRTRYAYKQQDVTRPNEFIHFKAGEQYLVHGLYLVDARDDPYHNDKIILYLSGSKVDVYAVVDARSNKSKLKHAGIGPICKA